MRRQISSTFRNKSEYWIGAAIFISTLAVFWPMLGDGFIDLDDPVHITANPIVQAGLTLRGIQWAFSTFYSDLWNPVVWISYMIDCQLYGLNPWGHHLTSLLLHAVNALALFLFWRRVTGSVESSAVATCWFALHPLRVESVAFAAERKDILSGLFWIATLWAYVFYAKTPNWKRYGATLAAYVLALMSKPIVVTLPAILLLMDYWPLARFRKRSFKFLALEKLPFLIFSLAVCAITLIAQKSYLVPQAYYPWYWRLGSAAVFYGQYLGKIFWPRQLALFYRHPGIALPVWEMIVAAAFLALLTVLAFKFRRRRPYLLMGWLWFLIVLIPVIGVVQITGRSIADRFTYLSQIGLCVAFAWGGAEVARMKPVLGRAWKSIVVITLAACVWRTRDQLRYWRDPRLLYEHTLAISPDNELVHNVLGVYLAKRGNLDLAQTHFIEAVRLRPNYADAHNNLGLLLERQNRRAEAIAQFREALSIEPDHPQARQNLDHLMRKVVR